MIFSLLDAGTAEGGLLRLVRGRSEDLEDNQSCERGKSEGVCQKMAATGVSRFP